MKAIKKKKALDLSQLTGLMAFAGDDLVDAIEKYGGKWDGKSYHIREAIARWEKLRSEFFPKPALPVDPKDVP